MASLYWKRTEAFAAAAALYYVALSAAHAFMLPQEAKPWMIGCALATACGALGVRRHLRRQAASMRAAEWGAAVLFLLPTINVLLHAILLQSAEQGGFFPIMAIGFALLSPSRRVLAFGVALQAAGAAALFVAVSPAPGATFVFVMASALAGAWLGGLFVLQISEDLLRQKDNAETLSRELEARVAERTTDLNAAMQAATAANLAKSQFLAVMSHELRTPLNAIIGYSEIMEEAAKTEGRTQDIEDHSRVLSAAHRLLHMINGILDLSKVEAGRLDLSLAEANVAELVREAIDALRPKAEESGVTLSAYVASDIGSAFTDGFRLSQCVMNLLSNAVKFSPGGMVALFAYRQDERIVFGVKDTGIGIAPDQIDRLFQPFTQADSSTTRRFGGTGLGLAITREIAQLLGGDVSVVSKLGEGSTFTLTIAARLRAPACALAA